jgi:hypothetical protein
LLKGPCAGCRIHKPAYAALPAVAFPFRRRPSRHARDGFALAPEAQLKVGYQFLPCLRGQVGYDFLYLSNVVRPGNQIDNVYDGVTRPTVPWNTSSYWGQGLTLSVQLNY